MIKNLLVINTSYLVKDPRASSGGAKIPMLPWNRSKKHVSHGSILLLPGLRTCLQRVASDRGEEGCSRQQDHADMGPHLGLCFLLGWHGDCYAARAFWGWHAVRCSSLRGLHLWCPPSSRPRVPTALLGKYSCSLPYSPSQEMHEPGERTGQDWTGLDWIALFGILRWA